MMERLLIFNRIKSRFSLVFYSISTNLAYSSKKCEVIRDGTKKKKRSMDSYG